MTTPRYEPVPESARRLPRSRYSHLTDREFARITEFEKASEELLAEYRARFVPRRDS